MNKFKFLKATKIILIVAGVLLLLWDLFAMFGGGLESTVSWAVWEWSGEYAFVSYSVAFVSGHLFWPGQRWQDERKKLEVCEMKLKDWEKKSEELTRRFKEIKIKYRNRRNVDD